MTLKENQPGAGAAASTNNPFLNGQTFNAAAAAAAAVTLQSMILNHHQQQQLQQQSQSAQNTIKVEQNANKIRKRSANQAYEYLTSMPDSKTFQEWLLNNETDFTWVHKRNSMTNAGKKYYYICNYRIKKGYVRCPAVIYALFPNSNDQTVMVYSCGDHEHKRSNGKEIIFISLLVKYFDEYKF